MAKVAQTMSKRFESQGQDIPIRRMRSSSLLLRPLLFILLSALAPRHDAWSQPIANQGLGITMDTEAGARSGLAQISAFSPPAVRDELRKEIFAKYPNLKGVPEPQKYQLAFKDRQLEERQKLFVKLIEISKYGDPYFDVPENINKSHLLLAMESTNALADMYEFNKNMNDIDFRRKLQDELEERGLYKGTPSKFDAIYGTKIGVESADKLKQDNPADVAADQRAEVRNFITGSAYDIGQLVNEHLKKHPEVGRHLEDKAERGEPITHLDIVGLKNEDGSPLLTKREQMIVMEDKRYADAEKTGGTTGRRVDRNPFRQIIGYNWRGQRSENATPYLAPTAPEQVDSEVPLGVEDKNSIFTASKSPFNDLRMPSEIVAHPELYSLQMVEYAKQQMKWVDAINRPLPIKTQGGDRLIFQKEW